MREIKQEKPAQLLGQAAVSLGRVEEVGVGGMITFSIHVTTTKAAKMKIEGPKKKE